MMLSEQLLINTLLYLGAECEDRGKTASAVFRNEQTAKAVSECVMRDVTALKRGVNKF
jgi:hypothetical protein